MDVLLASAVRFSEEAPLENPSVPAWAIGLFAFGVLVLLLVVTLMIKVGD